MDYTFLTGLLGSLVLVTGAAWPESKRKNQLFFVGGLIMLIYSIFGYLSGASIFFLILELLVTVSGVMMILNVSEKVSTPIIAVSGVALIIWSLYLFEGYNTLFFILGLSGIALGYVFKMGTVRRNIALTFGSALVALFSYIEMSWIFFWLNLFFALFSAYYLYKVLIISKQ